MSYAILHGDCYSCKRIFSANPEKVPSMRIDDNGLQVLVGGTQIIFCKPCVEKANRARERRGMDPLYIHPDAYEPVDWSV